MCVTITVATTNAQCIGVLILLCIMSIIEHWQWMLKISVSGRCAYMFLTTVSVDVVYLAPRALRNLYLALLRPCILWWYLTIITMVTATITTPMTATIPIAPPMIPPTTTAAMFVCFSAWGRHNKVSGCAWIHLNKLGTWGRLGHRWSCWCVYSCNRNITALIQHNFQPSSCNSTSVNQPFIT